MGGRIRCLNGLLPGVLSSSLSLCDGLSLKLAEWSLNRILIVKVRMSHLCLLLLPVPSHPTPRLLSNGLSKTRLRLLNGFWEEGRGHSRRDGGPVGHRSASWQLWSVCYFTGRQCGKLPHHVKADSKGDWVALDPGSPGRRWLWNIVRSLPAPCALPRPPCT